MRWLGTVNLILVGVILATVALFLCSKPKEISLTFIPRPEQRELPKSPFADAEEFFQEIGEGMLALNWVPPQMQLPDLRQELIYYGKNLRPDAIEGRESHHLALKTSGERMMIRHGERIYLVYQGNYSSKDLKRAVSKDFYASGDVVSQPPEGPLWGDVARPTSELNKNPTYAFSPGNQATPLWFEVRTMGDQNLEVCVSMLDEKGVLVTTPQQLQCFLCQAQEFPRTQIQGWELGGNRVDSTLLVRQKARWVGPDLFLAIHGGEEFSQVNGKERIDFLVDPLYSCFVTVGDFLIWEENRWHVVEPGEETEGFPIMVVKKIDDKILSMELWDSEGKGKTILSLIHAREHQPNPNIAQELKFVGAKTWAQFIVESQNGTRMTLQLHDWLVLTQDGWKKLDSPDQIDEYVNQNVSGPLFILDKMIKQHGKQVLVGHLFNTSRTEVEQIELPSTTGASLANYYHVPIVPPQIHLEEDCTEGNRE